MKKKVVISTNTAWNLLNFRSGLIRAMVAAGHEVVAIAPYDEYAPRLTALGCRYIPLEMDNQGTHPGRDLLLFWRFFKLLKKEKADVFLGYTVKPNVYGSLAAHALSIPVINNIAGLGSVFIRGGWLGRFVSGLYRLALFKSAKIFFQNPDDQQLFVSRQLVNSAVTDMLPGSGIDLSKYQPVALPKETIPRFLLIARMLRDKGVCEFVEAARILQERGIHAEFCLLGFLDAKNPTAISSAEMNNWVAEGAVHYLGTSDRVDEEIAKADCVVLPSYREGTPRTLLEAAAMARPLVTTDVPGCREVVDDGINGLLCQVRNATDLADKMEKICRLNREEKTQMGLQGRKKIEREFDEQLVIKKYLHAISEIH